MCHFIVLIMQLILQLLFMNIGQYELKYKLIEDVTLRSNIILVVDHQSELQDEEL